MKTLRFVSLGCPKNLVDSEVMMGEMNQAGYQVVADNQPADICMINTCCFIKEARTESQEIIDQAVNLKKDGWYKKVVVAGCWPQRSPEFLKKTYRKKIDALLGIFGREEAVKTCDRLLDATPIHRGSPRSAAGGDRNSLTLISTPRKDCRVDRTRLRITPRHYAYLRISEGCNNHCSYCVIPSLHGRYRSKPMETIVAEAQELARSGVKELNIVAQDTTSYGADLYGIKNLPILLRTISGIDGLEWIRLLYTHPAHFTDELIDEIARNEKIVKYVDLPIQHISDRLLEQMGRLVSQTDIKELVFRLRKKINNFSGNQPVLFLRTSVIVGFPGETEDDFQTLLDFIKETKFERLGVFQYSAEDGTSAARLAGRVPAAIKQKRFDAVMKLQQKIAFNHNKQLAGKKLAVIIEADQSGQNKNLQIRPEPGSAEPFGREPQNELLAEAPLSEGLTGRTYGDAPEADGLIYLTPNRSNNSGRLKTGDIRTALITGFRNYDLTGKIL